MRKDPPKTEFIYKKLCFYYDKFKPQSPSKSSPFDARHWLRLFSHCSKQFLNLLILIPFKCFCHFLLYLSHIGKTFLFEVFFHSGKQKKSLRVRAGEEEGWGTGVMPFLIQNCWTVGAAWAGVLINHPSWNGQTHWKSLQKKIQWSQTQPLTTTPDGTLIQMGS